MVILEKLLFFFIILSIALGVFLSHYHPSLFALYVREDYFIEQATFIILLASGILYIYRFFKHRKTKTRLFLASLLCIGLLLILAAGEEISWGQRIFGIQSGDFFRKYNLQNETNIHNLNIYNIRVNIDIIAKIQLIWALIYFGALPIIYIFKRKFINKITKHVALYICQKKQAFLLAAITVIIYTPGIIIHSRKEELCEFALAAIVLSSVLFPMNKNILIK